MSYIRMNSCLSPAWKAILGKHSKTGAVGVLPVAWDVLLKLVVFLSIAAVAATGSLCSLKAYYLANALAGEGKKKRI